jgi:thioester reductase-like protein
MKIEAILNRLSDHSGLALNPVEQMFADSKLPIDIVPPAVDNDPGNGTIRNVLLTGATGFLGAHLLRTLLQETDAHVWCLSRNSGDGLERIRTNLESYGIWESSFENRIDVVEGDLDRPDVGLRAADYRRLAQSIDTVYHCGAAVNWIYPYRRLAGVNVHGTRELLRFACTARPKAFHFVSSLSVCYSTTGPGRVDEHVNMLQYIDGMHLGYAQTKCVAETLLRQAAERGLPVSIYRSSIVIGDSIHGRSNCDDFLSRFIKGCIEMGCAPELDWFMDCCPVDTVAQGIVTLSRKRGVDNKVLRIFNFRNPGGRYWNECILWINLFGYPVRVIPYSLWIEELKRVSHTAGRPLRELAPFFCKTISDEPIAYLASLYEERRNIRLSSNQTTRALESAGIAWPVLDAMMFDRFFRSYITSGFLPTAPNCTADSVAAPAICLDEGRLSRLIGSRVLQAIPLRDITSNSIVSELTSWRFRTTAGLFPYRLELENEKSLSVMIKLKPRDSQVLDVAESIARLCSEELGNAYAAYRGNSEFVHCDSREPAVYAQADPRFTSQIPKYLGSDGNALAIELLADVELKDSAGDVSGWTEPCIRAALEGIASIHAVWLNRFRELQQDQRLGPTMIYSDATEVMPFWLALADHARPWFSSWAGSTIASIHERAISSIARHRELALQLPSTLTHNDFNPRNLALWNDGGALRLCAYDWEMAKWGLPQHDLAEMLCFVLPDTVEREVVSGWLEVHRVALERASGISIDPDGWQLGFELSIADLLINRLPMYTMVHRFRKQKFLERVVKTWTRLYRLFGMGA